MLPLLPLILGLIVAGVLAGFLGGNLGVISAGLVVGLTGLLVMVIGAHDHDQQQHRQLAAAVQARYGVTLLAGPTGDGEVTVRERGGATLPCLLTGSTTAPVLRCVTAELPRTGR